MLNRTTLELPPTSGHWTGQLENELGEPGFVDRRAPDRLRLDLHDRLGPGLAVLEMQIASLQGNANSADFLAQVTSLRTMVVELIEELRRIVHAEPPERLERDGLVAAVRRAAALSTQPGLEVSFAHSGSQFEPANQVAIVIYRAALEGIANVVHHAHASSCLVTLRMTNEAVTLKVRDDGVGPRPRVDLTDYRSGGLGLSSLGLAARALGGKARLINRREGGTTLVVSVPQRFSRDPNRTAQASSSAR